ncbi:hypothetical protein SprV_0602081800 [Sparganum proliferum]
MHIGALIHLLIAGFTLFELGYGQGFCNWSRRIIPSGATGNFTVEVPIYYSYRCGYINDVPFGTYPWARGWCTYKQDYFRCSYGKRDGTHTTVLTLPQIETISYVMLEDSHPITLHKPDDKTVPGFYVKENDQLDVCSKYYTVVLWWHFNGNESDLQNISCYLNGKRFCSGLRPYGTKGRNKCGFQKAEGRIHIGYMFYNSATRFGYYYCYVDKEQTRALTYIVDWKDAKKTRDTSIMAELNAHRNTTNVPPITTSGANIMPCEISVAWMWLVITKQLGAL